MTSETVIRPITPARVDICPPITSVEKKQSQRERRFDFHLYYFTGKKQTRLSGDIGNVANAVPKNYERTRKAKKRRVFKV